MPTFEEISKRDGSILKDEARLAIAKRYYAYGVASEQEEAEGLRQEYAGYRQEMVAELGERINELNAKDLEIGRLKAVARAAQLVAEDASPHDAMAWEIVAPELLSALRAALAALPKEEG